MAKHWANDDNVKSENIAQSCIIFATALVNINLSITYIKPLLQCDMVLIKIHVSNLPRILVCKNISNIAWFYQFCVASLANNFRISCAISVKNFTNAGYRIVLYLKVFLRVNSCCIKKVYFEIKCFNRSQHTPLSLNHCSFNKSLHKRAKNNPRCTNSAHDTESVHHSIFVL